MPWVDHCQVRNLLTTKDHDPLVISAATQQQEEQQGEQCQASPEAGRALEAMAHAPGQQSRLALWLITEVRLGQSAICSSQSRDLAAGDTPHMLCLRQRGRAIRRARASEMVQEVQELQRPAAESWPVTGDTASEVPCCRFSEPRKGRWYFHPPTCTLTGSPAQQPSCCQRGVVR